MKILAINPGASSTKLGVFEDEQELFNETIRHTPEELAPFSKLPEQTDFRKSLVEEALAKHSIKVSDLAAIVGRGGTFKPMAGGTYRVNQAMTKDVHEGRVQADHASNLGCLIAYALAEPAGLPAYIVDPVCVDEFDDISRISGMPELPRLSLSHALNIRAMAHRAARELGKPFTEVNLVVAHLGTGISIAAMRAGRIVDVNNANDGGPIAPQRTGTLPATGLAKLCFSGKFDLASMKDYITKKGGLFAHLGTDNVTQAAEMVASGDEKAKLIFSAMAYTVAKDIGAYAAALGGKYDAIVITGGIAYVEPFVKLVLERISFLGKVLLYPGEDELSALTGGVLRVLRKEEKEQVYQ